VVLACLEKSLVFGIAGIVHRRQSPFGHDRILRRALQLDDLAVCTKLSSRPDERAIL
jgi:hypothetical protein